METVIHLLTGDALIAGIRIFGSPFETVKGLRKLKGREPLSDSIFPQKEITVSDFIICDRSAQHPNRPWVP
jgi:hypothetical protein